jgi:hypothetical protein
VPQKKEVDSLAIQETNEQKLALMYSFLHRFLHELYKAEFFEGKSFTMHRAQQTMMYMAVNRLDAEQFARLDFTQNFGIDSEVRAKFIEAMKNGGGYDSNVKLFKSVDTLMLLKLHKYLNWADKKLHTVLFAENKDQINEDLLVDF